MPKSKSNSEILYKKNRHCCYDLQYHMVFVTKHRKPVIQGDIETRLHEIVKDLLKSFKCNLVKVNSESDHVHILFEAPPQIALSVLANNLKTVTARRLRKEFPEELSQYYNEPCLWAESYFVGSVSERTKAAVQQYIQNQKG